MENISSVNSPGFPERARVNLDISGNEIESKESFRNVFFNMINNTNESLAQSEKTLEGFVKGEISNPHEVMISLEEANLNLQFVVQMRNKVVEAYNEIMRMQL